MQWCLEKGIHTVLVLPTAEFKPVDADVEMYTNT
jgi:hypothetical protein